MKNIAIVGVGGQGTLLASKVLGLLAMEKGYDVKVSEVHGMAQRGGSVVTFVRYGREVQKPTIEAGEADILLAFEKLEGLRYAFLLKKEGQMILNDWKMEPMPVLIGMESYPEEEIEGLRRDYLVHLVKGMEKAKFLGDAKGLNMILLGVVAKYLEFSLEQWMEALKSCVPKDSLERNQKAFILGYEEEEEVEWQNNCLYL